MARAFENGPIDFGDAKEMMRKLKDLKETPEERRADMKEMIKNIEEDIESKNRETKGRLEGISPSDLSAIKAQRKINKENLI